MQTLKKTGCVNATNSHINALPLVAQLKWVVQRKPAPMLLPDTVFGGTFPVSFATRYLFLIGYLIKNKQQLKSQKNEIKNIVKLTFNSAHFQLVIRWMFFNQNVGVCLLFNLSHKITMTSYQSAN